MPNNETFARKAARSISVPFSTILKIAFFVLLIWAVLKLWPTFLLVLFAILLAVTFSPVTEWLEARGLSHGMSVALLGLVLVGVIVGLAWVVLPPLTDQATAVFHNLPAMKRRAERQLAGHSFLQMIVPQIFDLPSSPEFLAWRKQPLALGAAAIEAVVSVALVLVLTLYLLADGKKLYAWVLAYVPRDYRSRLRDLFPEVEEVVAAYVLAQIVTSILFGGFVLVVLLALKVPAAVPLAVIAAFCDVLPVVGIIISMGAAALMALSVSPVSAAIVIALYLAYHLFETYLLVPRLYGKRLRLSGLAVLIALLIGAALQGIVGAVLILPLVAAYPVIERHLLRDYLHDEVLSDHAALAAADAGDKDKVAEAVMRGEEHADEGTEAANEERSA